MLRLLPLLFLLFSSCQTQSFTEVTGVWTPVSHNETLGSLSQLFYGHENLWELLAGSNKKSSFALFSPDNALTKDTIVASKILIPPASNCPLYMNSSCLQILNYLEEKHNGLKGDETISELLKTKLNLDTPLVWDTRIKDDATTTLPQEEDGSRTLQALEPMELFLISWDISTLFRENLGLTAKHNVTRGTFSLNIINQTPKTLTDFEFLSDQCASRPSQSFWTPLLIEPGKTGQVISQQLHDTDTGVVKLRVDEKNSFLITWKNENLTSLPTEAHVLRVMPDTVSKEEQFDNKYICSSPQEWKTTRLNHRYSVQAFVGGTKENRVANLIISEDWKDDKHILNDIYPKSFYKILNHQKSFMLTASTNYSNPLYPIYQVYQSDQIYGKYQEWRIDLIELSGPEEVGYLIRNSQSGLVLSIIEPNILVLQRYEENDQDKLRAQVWLLKLLDDNSYHIQNLKFNTYLSTQDKVNNYASWTLRSSVDETKVTERFFLDFLRTDKGPLTPSIQENYYYSFAPEKFPEMKVTPEKASEKVKILSPSSTAGALDNNMGYWLLKRVTLPGRNITGYLIMNHYLNVVLTMKDDKTLITSRLEKNTNLSLAESQLWQITLNQSDSTKTSYTISSMKDSRYFVSLNGGSSHGSQLFLTKNADTKFIFTNSDVEGYVPYRYSAPYHVNSFATLEPYVVGASEITDLTLNGAIVGSTATEQKQKWSINAALWGATDALTLRSNAEILGRTDFYLSTINGTPQLVLQDLAGKKYEQSWQLVADPEYYDLVYQINPYNLSHLYLTTPIPQTINANFTLTNDSKSQGQRFRFMVANEAFPVFNSSTVPPTKIPDDNFYFQLSHTINSQMKISVGTDNSTLTLSAGIPIRNRQYWLLKRVTLPGTTTVGTIIMNHELNIVLTQQDTTRVNGVTMVKASSTDNAALGQLWDVQMLDDNSCTIRNFRYPNYYLNLINGPQGASLIPLPMTLYNSQKAGENPLQISSTYMISVGLNREPYIVDTYDHKRIYGWQNTGYDKQRWMVSQSSTSTPDVYLLKSEYDYPRDELEYFMSCSASTSTKPTLIAGLSTVNDDRRWKIVPDPDYHGLFFTVLSLQSNRYLTAPASKTFDADYTLEASTTRPQDQRFRFMTSYNFQLIPDDYYYTVALETNDELRLEATALIASSVEVQPKDLTDRRQYWLFRRTSSNGVTGYIILNDDQNAAITLSTANKIVGAPVINRALNTNYNSQVWDIELLEGDLCRFKSLKTPTLYLALNGNTNLVASTTSSSFKCSKSSRKGTFSFANDVFHYIMAASEISPYVAKSTISTTTGTVTGEPRALVANDQQSWEMRLYSSGVYNVINRYRYPVYMTYQNAQLSTRTTDETFLQRWEVETDADYHNLYYRIQEYATVGRLYLQAPSTKNTGSLFKLDELATTAAGRQEQRFRIKPINEDL